MGPIRGLWRDTWWLWCVFLVAILGVAYVVTPFFVILIPIFLVVFVYFSFVRYDDQGRNKGDLV